MLTQVQKDEVFNRALDVVFEDVQQNSDYLWGILQAYLETRTPEQLAVMVSSDADLWPEFFDFDPVTGEPWPEDPDCVYHYPDGNGPPMAEPLDRVREMLEGDA